MQVISLKDYAKNRNITYEAVRKQVVRYSNELDGHLIKDGRQQFLDEEAVAFLDEKRRKNAISIYQIEKDEEIDRLKEQNNNLLLELAETQKQLLETREKYHALNDQSSKIALLEADNEAAKARISEAEKALAAEKEKSERDADTASKILEMTIQESEERERKERERAEKAEEEAARAKKELEDLRTASFFERVFAWKKRKNQE